MPAVKDRVSVNKRYRSSFVSDEVVIWFQGAIFAVALNPSLIPQDRKGCRNTPTRS